MEKIQINRKKLPDSSGVYFFLNKQKKPIYIGKATSLKDRVKSYFAKDIDFVRSPLIKKMVEEAKTIEFKETQSVLEALLLEADLIRKFKPTYNTKEKDDKSFNCVAFTKEDFPQLIIIRKKNIDFSSLTTNYYKLSTIFGPFANGSQLKEALKIIRKIFPYRDEKCKLNSKRPCFNYSIGLCPGTCIGLLDKKCYAVRVKRIEKLLSGKVGDVVKDLEKEMKKLAKEEKFEPAKILRDKIFALQHINDVSLIKSDQLSTIHHSLTTLPRIEAYDIAHLQGSSMVGVMTVVLDGVADKSSYRKFNINSKNPDDTKSLSHILERRLKHTEWPMPNLIVVDGGIAQLNAIKEVLVQNNIEIPVVSVVKDEQHKPKDILGEQIFAKKYKKEILLANSESHRFAIGFHKKKRRRNFLV